MSKILLVRNFMLLLLLLFGPLDCHAQVSHTPTFCWMVLSKESKIPSFIFGTVHHLGPQPVLDNKQLMNFILKSKLIVQEADTAELLHQGDNNFDFSCQIPLNQLLGPADYLFVKKEFYLATGKDLEKYKNIMPQMIMIMIDEAKVRKKKILKMKRPLMEAALYAVSTVKKIPIQGLETGKEMFNIMFKGMPLHDQAALLMYNLNNPQFATNEDSMKICFDRQDLKCFCSIEDMQHYSRPGDSTIIVKRNLFWIPKIKQYISQGNAFIAVGAAHLCGDYGIISLLKNDGYIIAPIITR